MKKPIIISATILCAVNLLLGLIISAYGCLNIAISTIIIILTAIILLAVNRIVPLKDGYKVSLNIIFPAIGFIQYLLAVFMPNRFSDNWGLIAIIILVAIETILLVVANSISTKIK